MILSKVSNRIKNEIRKIGRAVRNRKDRLRLTDAARTASILSMNCIGGILSHDLGLRFLSPTVNLFFRAEDFIKFCENLDYYLSIDKFVECRDPAIIGRRSYPIAFLGDLTLYLVHYRSVAEAQEKWNARKKRVNRENIVLIDTDREGMTEVLKDRFEALPYRKVLFTHLPDETHKSCFYLKGYEKEPCVGIITDHDSLDGTRPIDQFDYVSFLNGNDVSNDSELSNEAAI